MPETDKGSLFWAIFQVISGREGNEMEASRRDNFKNPFLGRITFGSTFAIIARETKGSEQKRRMIEESH